VEKCKGKCDCDNNNNNSNNNNNNNNFNKIRVVVKLENEHWYDHVPKLAETDREGKATILWIQQVQTDGTILDNKPDITVRRMKRDPTC
jgi:hypothetical protein